MKLKNCLLTAACTLAAALAAQASTLVSVNTTGLIGHPSGPFYLDFQLNDGTGANDNHVNISAINLGGGTPVGPATLFGGASGDLLAGITLTDTEPFNEFYQQFTPGAWLSFRLTMTGVFTGSVPDLFSFAILDSELFNLGTYSLGSDQFLIANLDGPDPVIEVYASLDGSVPAPHIPDTGSTLALAVVAAAGLGLVRCLARGRIAA